MFRNHPDARFIPLTDPQEVGAWAPGKSLTWKLNGLPTTLTASSSLQF